LAGARTVGRSAIVALDDNAGENGLLELLCLANSCADTGITARKRNAYKSMAHSNVISAKVKNLILAKPL
ncbi:MAG: hypothetical protein K2X81_03380, partial [Candidatus Obscuribacterales bacterium]|nr:hypothetical protein [Candidatus Obscuribacterales bacterium]